MPAQSKSRFQTLGLYSRSPTTGILRHRLGTARRAPGPFSIQFTTSLIIALRGMMCDVSWTTRRLCSGGVPSSLKSGSWVVSFGFEEMKAAVEHQHRHLHAGCGARRIRFRQRRLHT